LLESPNDTQPPHVVGTLVDVALAWAAQGHHPKDPPTHAVVLVSKALIPNGTCRLLQGLSSSSRLAGLDALVGVVDTVGEGAKGVSVLLASHKERVQIDTMSGLLPMELRVGKWHAKDAEQNMPFNFEEVMASIRGGASVKPAQFSPTAPRDFILALGGMETMSSQAPAINQRYPSADVVCPTLCLANWRWGLLWPEHQRSILCLQH
jgi:hypothetical protein